MCIRDRKSRVREHFSTDGTLRHISQFLTRHTVCKPYILLPVQASKSNDSQEADVGNSVGSVRYTADVARSIAKHRVCRGRVNVAAVGPTARSIYRTVSQSVAVCRSVNM